MGIPIMILVDGPSCCYCKLNVPTGIISLEQSWGKKQGMMNPGCYCCYCSYKRIAAMITKNSIRFNTPIESVPTKDNVKISIDIGITFHIGEEASREEDCEKFLYYLGATKLEELLDQESDESIRNFIRQHKVNQIRDIKSELTTQMMAELNMKFNQFGVYIEQVNIMNVIVPKDLRMALELATTYDVHLQNQVKYQENVKIKMMNENNMQLLSLKRTNLTKIVELEHFKRMEEIEFEEKKVEAETKQALEMVEAQKEQNVKIIQAEARKSQAEKRAQKKAAEILAEANAYSEKLTIDANNKSQVLTVQAENRLKAAQVKTNGLVLEAEVEGSQAANLEAKRKHEQRMALASNMEQLGRHNKLVVSGKQGEDILGYFKETADLVNSAE